MSLKSGSITFASLVLVTTIYASRDVIHGNVQTSKGLGYVEYSTPASHPTEPKPTRFGVVMLGGHGDVDEATAFLCDHSGGGKLVVLRASGEDDYNQEFHEKCPTNSVTTIVFSGRDGAEQPWVAQQLRDAHAIFIAGGDQSHYIQFWKDTPVQTEINAAVARGVPIAGISAGLAVEGEFVFSAMIDTVTSPQALANPYDEHVTLDRDFLVIPQLKGVITDSHFSARERMGRSIVFLSRIVQDGWAKQVHGIGIDETTAVLVEADGSVRVVGEGSAFFMTLNRTPEVCANDKPLTVGRVAAFQVHAGPHAVFDLKSWSSPVSQPLLIQVTNGVMTVTKG
ncbi:MAG: cyanophycinase [Candidatus Acidiferrales bacterium]